MRNCMNLLLMLVLAVSAKTLLAQDGKELAPSGTVVSVIGCLIQRGHGFLVRNDNGSHQLETNQDLSQYVNKRVKITGTLKQHYSTAASADDGTGAVITNLSLRMMLPLQCEQKSAGK
jgi:hypothetical protein